MRSLLLLFVFFSGVVANGAEPDQEGLDFFEAKIRPMLFSHCYEWTKAHRSPHEVPVTVPATDSAEQWDGWGTAVKPAVEHWILCRKPLKGSVAANVIEHGVGGINIDGCRVPLTGDEDLGSVQRQKSGGMFRRKGEDTHTHYKEKGRWPAITARRLRRLQPIALQRDMQRLLLWNRTGG